MSDIAAALTGSLPRDGSAPMTGDLQLSGATPANGRSAVSKDYVTSFLATATGMPTGSVVAYAGNVAPAGFLECNGQAVSRTTYSDLFNVVSTIYGAGNGVDTFNVPDMRDEFIRGKSAARAVGSKQVAAFASHTHATSDPGHVHPLIDPGHAHSASQPAHTHGVNDPGHSHAAGFQIAGVGVSAATAGSPWQANTDASLTGISIQAGGGDAVTVNLNGTYVSVANAVAGLSIGATGDGETRPQNIAQIYIIKAVSDAGPITGIAGITSSDVNMIDIGVSNPAIPELLIKSNVAFGTVKLDASGKVPILQMPTSSSQFLGYFDASPGTLPADPATSGDYYAVSVQGTLTVYDPVTLVASPTLVVVGSQLHYVTGSVTNPTGWYTLTVSGATLASDVQFIPTGTISSANVQLAISELDSETQIALSSKPDLSSALPLADGTANAGSSVFASRADHVHPSPNAPTAATTSFTPAGNVAAANVQLAIEELDNEKLALTGGFMAGTLTMNAGQKLQFGSAIDQSKTFVLSAPTPLDGTLTLERTDGTDIMKVLVDGQINMPGMPFSKSSNGYVTLPNGLIIQWGSDATVASDLAVAFPIIFPVAVASVQTTMVTGATTTQLFSTTVDAISSSGFSVRKRFQSGSTTSGATEPFNWIAIGY